MSIGASAATTPRTSTTPNALYTPAWQEQFTGIHRDTVLRFARDWIDNAEKTNGKNMIIIGAGANHWYHNNLLYRSGIVALMLTGSVGVNGGGLAHYVGQEKLVCHASWGAIAFGGDWGMAPRHQNTPSFHYVHSDQWRYERGYSDYDTPAGGRIHSTITRSTIRRAPCIAAGFRSIRSSSRTHSNSSPGPASGATTDEEIITYVVERSRAGISNSRSTIRMLPRTGRGPGSSGAETLSGRAPRA